MTVFQSNEELPFVSIIVVNYNGKQFLPACFSALSDLNYPLDRYETILVDNASSDGSISYLMKNFPRVRIIMNDKNLGFAGGNNAAIRQAKGEYIALLNNDACVDRNWLLELMKIAMSDSRIGACTSKMLFCSYFMTLIIKSHSSDYRKEVTQDDDGNPGIVVESLKIDNFKSRFAGGPYDIEYMEGSNGIRKSIDAVWGRNSGTVKIRLPVSEDTVPLIIDLRIGAVTSEINKRSEVSFYVENREIKKINLTGSGYKDYRLTIPPDIIESSKYELINNVGSIIYNDGYAADRGFYEKDTGQYERIEEVFAACGASVLYKKGMLDDVGLFDEDFFMYYEDTDLSWRARSRGWKIYYCPGSIVHHVHCGSSVEMSPLFIFHTEKNRLFMLMKNANIDLVIKSIVTYIVTAIPFSYTMSRKKTVKLQNDFSKLIKLRYRVILTVLRHIPLMFKKRAEIQGNKTVSSKEINKWMVKP